MNIKERISLQYASSSQVCNGYYKHFVAPDFPFTTHERVGGSIILTEL